MPRLSSPPAADAVRAALLRRLEGLAPGDRLPSVRELMRTLRKSPVTIERALGALAREGRLIAHPGRGTFVAHPPPSPTGAPDLGWQAVSLGESPPGSSALLELLSPPAAGAVPLVSGYPDGSLHPPGLAAALARAGRRPGVWGKAPLAGVEALRAWFARETGAGYGPDDVIIVPGGQAALSTIFRAVGRPGTPILVESPTYLGALALARACGLHPVPVPIDAGGVRPDLLARAFARSGARLLYLQPAHQNPTGASLAPDRRGAVLDAAAAAGAFVIEDDYARDLTIDGPPPRPLCVDDGDGRIIYVRSLTKSAAPSLRVAAICARGPVLARLLAARIADDFFVAGPLQETAVELVTSPGWQRHRRRVRQVLASRRDALAAAIGAKLRGASIPLLPRGGFNIWVRLPDSVEDVALARAAARAGVHVSPGRPWFPAEPDGSWLRLSFNAAEGAVLGRGIALLAGAFSRITAK
jgi:DNA-binding transcriptional MocR family regulator